MASDAAGTVRTPCLVTAFTHSHQLNRLTQLLQQTKALSEIQRDTEKTTGSLQALKDEGTLLCLRLCLTNVVSQLRKRHHDLALELSYVPRDLFPMAANGCAPSYVPQAQSLSDILMTELKEKTGVGTASIDRFACH